MFGGARLFAVRSGATFPAAATQCLHRGWVIITRATCWLLAWDHVGIVRTAGCVVGLSPAVCVSTLSGWFWFLAGTLFGRFIF